MLRRSGSDREHSQRLLHLRDSVLVDVEYVDGSTVFETPCTLRCATCHAHIANSFDVRRIRKRSKPGDVCVMEIECEKHRGAEFIETAQGSHAVCKHCRTPLSTSNDSALAISATPTSLSIVTASTTTTNSAFFAHDAGWLPLQFNARQMLLSRPWTIAIFSLTPDEHRPICDKIEATYEAVTVMMVPLHLASLRSYQGAGVLSPAIDLVIVAHAAEGRVLLTDQDGLYNALIKRAVEVTDGNLVLLLTSALDGDEESQLGQDEVADDAVVEELADECGQESLRVVASCRRFWTAGDNLFEGHLRTLRLALDRVLDPLPLPAGVASQCPSPRLTTRVFCEIL